MILRGEITKAVSVWPIQIIEQLAEGTDLIGLHSLVGQFRDQSSEITKFNNYKSTICNAYQESWLTRVSAERCRNRQPNHSGVISELVEIETLRAAALTPTIAGASARGECSAIG